MHMKVYNIAPVAPAVIEFPFMLSKEAQEAILHKQMTKLLPQGLTVPLPTHLRTIDHSSLPQLLFHNNEIHQGAETLTAGSCSMCTTSIIYVNQ